MPSRVPLNRSKQRAPRCHKNSKRTVSRFIRLGSRRCCGFGGVSLALLALTLSQEGISSRICDATFYKVLEIALGMNSVHGGMSGRGDLSTGSERDGVAAVRKPTDSHFKEAKAEAWNAQ